MPKVTIWSVPEKSSLSTLSGAVRRFTGFLPRWSKHSQRNKSPFVARFAERDGRGKITSLEVASIAFVWSPAQPPPAFRLFAGRCPTPFYEDWRNHMKRYQVQHSDGIKDRQAIKELAKRSGMSMSDYVTACCLGKQVVVVDGLKKCSRS